MTDKPKPIAKLHVNIEEKKIPGNSEQYKSPMSPEERLEAVWGLFSKADIGAGNKKVGANDFALTQEEIGTAALPIEEFNQVKEIAGLFAYKGNLDSKPDYPVTKDKVKQMLPQVIYDKDDIEAAKQAGIKAVNGPGYKVLRAGQTTSALTPDEKLLKISALEERYDLIDANSDGNITYLEMLENNGPFCVVPMPASSLTMPTPEEVAVGKDMIEARSFASAMWKKAHFDIDADRDGLLTQKEVDAAAAIPAKAMSVRFIADVKALRSEADESLPVSKKDAYEVAKMVVYTKDEVAAFSDQVKAGQADIINKVKSGALVLENREQAVADIGAGQQLVQALDTLKNGAGVTYAEAAKLTKGNGTSLVAPAPAVKQAGEDGLTSAVPAK